jgi:hypothetical protein
MKEGGDVSKKQQPKKKKAVIVVIILMVILIVMAGILIFILLRDKEPERVVEERGTGGRGILATEENYESVFEEIEKPVDDNSFLVNMSMTLLFETWDKSARHTYVRNDAGNIRTMYFDLYLDDENGNRGELIYSSPYIPVGRELKDFGLNQELAAGEYNVTLVYRLVDDDYQDITDVVVGVNMIIEK